MGGRGKCGFRCCCIPSSARHGPAECFVLKVNLKTKSLRSTPKSVRTSRARGIPRQWLVRLSGLHPLLRGAQGSSIALFEDRIPPILMVQYANLVVSCGLYCVSIYILYIYISLSLPLSVSAYPFCISTLQMAFIPLNIVWDSWISRLEGRKSFLELLFGKSCRKRKSEGQMHQQLQVAWFFSICFGFYPPIHFRIVSDWFSAARLLLRFAKARQHGAMAVQQLVWIQGPCSLLQPRFIWDNHYPNGPNPSQPTS